MNTTDLRELLAERAESASTTHSPMATDRVSDALGRARSLRRRRVALAGATVAAVAAIFAAITVPTVLSADGPGPASPVDMDLPDYAHGGVLIGRTTIELPDTEATITVTPEAQPLLLSAKCDTALQVTLRHGEGIINGSPCDTRDGYRWFGEWGPDPTSGDWGIELGKPVTLDITVGASRDGDVDAKLPKTGTVTLGIYESVPWDEYVFPEPPEELIEPDELFRGGDSGSSEVVESADDPNEPVTVQFEGEAFDLQIKTQTPGIMRVLINGEEAAAEQFWDYDAVPFFFEASQDSNDPNRAWAAFEEPVEITFLPEEFSGAWRALLTECEIDEDGNGRGCGP